MGKRFYVALLLVIAVGAAHNQAQAQTSAPDTAAATAPTPAPTPAKKKTKKKNKQATQNNHVDLPEGASPAQGAEIRPSGAAGGNGTAETILESTSPDNSKKSTANPAKPGDIDDEITNARLRASTGSKSPFSVSTAINYNGGSVAKPFDATRPKLSPGTLNQEPSLLGGTVAVKYRLTEHDNLNLGVGVNWVNPGHGETYKGGQFIEHGEAADPYLAYTRLFKWAGLQNVFNLQVEYYTDKAATDNNDTFESDIDHTFLYEFGKTGLQLGVDIGWTHDFYSSYNLVLKDKLGSAVDELFAYPFLEYEFTKMFSFRTVYRGLTYFTTQEASWTFIRDAVTQSAGIGIAVTRDIYLYPNVQWIWSDIDAKKTNIALSTNINLF